MPVEKCTEQVKLHLSEEMLRDIQDQAMQEDRAVSEWMRVQLRQVLYGKRFASVNRTQAGIEDARGEQGLDMTTRRRRESPDEPADYPITTPSSSGGWAVKSPIRRALADAWVRFFRLGPEKGRI